MRFPKPTLNGWSWFKGRTYKGIQIWISLQEEIHWLFQEFDESGDSSPVGGYGHEPTRSQAYRSAFDVIDTFTDPFPTEDQLEYWVIDSVVPAVDGCQVEPDGVCPHRCKSWLLVLGLV